MATQVGLSLADVRDLVADDLVACWASAAEQGDDVDPAGEPGGDSVSSSDIAAHTASLVSEYFTEWVAMLADRSLSR